MYVDKQKPTIRTKIPSSRNVVSSGYGKPSSNKVDTNANSKHINHTAHTGTSSTYTNRTANSSACSTHTSMNTSSTYTNRTGTSRSSTSTKPNLSKISQFVEKAIGGKLINDETMSNPQIGYISISKKGSTTRSKTPGRNSLHTTEKIFTTKTLTHSVRKSLKSEFTNPTEKIKSISKSYLVTKDPILSEQVKFLLRSLGFLEQCIGDTVFIGSDITKLPASGSKIKYKFTIEKDTECNFSPIKTDSNKFLLASCIVLGN